MLLLEHFLTTPFRRSVILRLCMDFDWPAAFRNEFLIVGRFIGETLLANRQVTQTHYCPNRIWLVTPSLINELSVRKSSNEIRSSIECAHPWTLSFRSNSSFFLLPNSICLVGVLDRATWTTDDATPKNGQFNFQYSFMESMGSLHFSLVSLKKKCQFT